MEKLSGSQRARITRTASKGEGESEAGELNVVPFLDILVNIMMFVLATITTIFTASIDTAPPTHTNIERGEPALNLTILVVHDGFSVKARGGNLATGCDSVGAGLAVPRSHGEYDYDALKACVAKVKGATALDESQVMITADADVPYHAIVSTMDAVRKTTDGSMLFPDVVFALAN